MPSNYSIYEDIDLVEMIRLDHDQLAFEEIYMRYADHLFKLAFRKINVKEAAEDIVQITFLKLWSNRHHLKINHSVKAYLYTSAKNNIISFYFRQLTKAHKNIDSIQSEFLPHDNSTQDSLDFEQTLALYRESLEELPDKCREVFELSRSGYSLKEIAELKNISPKTAEAHISKALKYLRSKMGGAFWTFLLVLIFF
ncbi:MAG TPA: RNA polymerase sigma-70 factor [Chitinophagaceae bacterium]|nr:RNA polymerase sigma-70 factor [Chitinophagaceae bacterium]